MKHVIASLAFGACLVGSSVAVVFAANPHNTAHNPNSTGQPSQSCQFTTTTPGGAASAPGSPFNPSGQAGNVYAGNPDTASLAHSGSSNAVSQYDVACFQQP
ncbi:hypothetical protein SAMN05444161_8811 [Rhizobiales bacterium GAS191]|nr:hypothetical protein SAMN05444161_8811 [Rhizobiales bacterium GAS191]